MELAATESQSGGPAELDILMSQYQQADTAAAAALIRRVSPMLYRFFVSDATGRQDAEDMLQETWLQIHKARHTWRPKEPVLPWLYAIARHVKVDAYRKRQRTHMREQPMDSVPEPAAATGNPSRNLPDFSTLVACLPDGQREVVTMLKVTGMSVEEVAQATSSTAGAVKLKAHRAYEKLRAVLGKTGSNDEGGRKAEDGRKARNGQKE